jgi:hypothetical protein
MHENTINQNILLKGIVLFAKATSTNTALAESTKTRKAVIGLD